MTARALIALLFALACPLAVAAAVSPAKTAAQAGLVDIRSLVPDIGEDIKYAGSDNFLGRPAAGYLTARCLLQRPAAEALARIERELRAQHLRLHIWDCYRPARAVADFVRWTREPADPRSRQKHYPTLDKSQLLGEYIAAVSGHSRGYTVDLTLQRCSDNNARCQSLDMGTDFDFFGPAANTDDSGLTPEQRANRQRLVKAMAGGGFDNYPMEWWHYTLQSEPTPHVVYDVPIR